jgi:imidazolonepropionase
MTFRVIAGGLDGGAASGLLITGAAAVATMAGGLRRGAAQDEPALLAAAGAGDRHGGRDADRDAGDAPVIAVWDGLVLAVGPRDETERALEAWGYPLERFARFDAAGGLVTPGLVDPHTHLLFAGTREAELRLRQQGAGYLEILAAGGGILSTVAATRSASTDDLLAHGRRWLDAMLAHGTTTVEAKSGYGLDLATELRLLDVAHRLGEEGPVEVVPTFLGAHAVAPEFRSRPDGTEGYVRHLLESILPGVAAQGRARFCDVFCEEGVFTADQSRRILEAARAVGMDPRLHADELAPSGGAELAAEVGAWSADHLGAPSEAGLEALAAVAAGERPVIAILLPSTSWFLMKPEHAPARRMIELGIPVALGTDFNPGTSPVPSLPLVMTLAVLELGLTPAEALAAVTVNAAHSLGLGDEVGSIEPGHQADLVIWRVPSIEQLPYWAGADLVRTVIKRGRVVLERG